MSKEKLKKLIFKYWWWLGIIILIVGIIIFFTIFADKSKEQKGKDKYTQFKWPNPNAKYITAVPVDLEQIQSIYKYRSCAGHIRDGYTFKGVLENDSSMKHYFLPILELQGTLDRVKLFAPYDGTIIYIDYEKDKVIPERPHNGGGLHFVSSVDSNASVVYGHIYTVKDYKVGDKVKAGELVGYAALGQKGNDFDIDLSTPWGTSAYNNREVLDSIFDHMTPKVLAEFAKYEITPENTKFTKKYRDANPCNYETIGPSEAQIKESRILLKGRVPEVEPEKGDIKK